MTDRDGQLRVTKLQRHTDDGYWTARVNLNGVTVEVDRQHGSWQATVRRAPGHRTFLRRDVLPYVAAALQDRVRTLETREQRTTP